MVGDYDGDGGKFVNEPIVEIAYEFDDSFRDYARS